MRFKHCIYLIILTFLIHSCNSKKNLHQIPILESVIETQEIILDEAVIQPDTRSYRTTETRINDLLHMNLSVSFDWEDRTVLGNVGLTLKPYFYPTNELVLDAKGMEIHSVNLKNGNTPEPLQYTYDGSYIKVMLEKTYSRDDQYTVLINYTAFPEKLPVGGSSAITMDQGIYFINPDSTEVNKPTQIWTQGETEANSVWFPTIDSPNERMSQEVQITVLEKYKTLSNGELVFSNYNGNGTRTDYWRQELPHAPYLVMLAVGDYTVVTDSWVNADNEEIAVDYYLEPEYAEYARDIFGNTTEMLTFYSEVLGYPYPWDKYSQIVVRDFVSGAMENTSAVIHGDFLNSTDRELLDDDNEDVIAHELFHHWFGDLVTCESWSNLPLNESFATYGEYLWIEHKYGRDAADLHGMNSMNGYLSEAQSKSENLIRFIYDDKDDMFDAHSYNKGGRILHMLRYFLGDDAFFSGLKFYLEQNQFEAVEIHQLRLAMEKVSGKDLNWFFNQWFLSNGHPDIQIDYLVNDSLQTVEIQITQTQEKLFRLPLMVDIYSDSGNYRTRLDVRNRKETFSLDSKGKLLFVNVDAEKVLLGTKTDNRPEEWWGHQYDNALVLLDRLEALNASISGLNSSSLSVIENALDDPFWSIRQRALDGATHLLVNDTTSIIKNLKKMASLDSKSSVRSKSLLTLSDLSDDESLVPIYMSALDDRSFMVMAAGLQGLANADTDLGLSKAKELESESNNSIKITIATIYAEVGKEDKNSFLISSIKSSEGYDKFELVGLYSQYLSKQTNSFINENMAILEETASKDNVWWIRLSGYGGLKVLQEELGNRSEGNLEAAELKKIISEKINALLSKEPNEQIKSMIIE